MSMTIKINLKMTEKFSQIQCLNDLITHCLPAGRNNSITQSLNNKLNSDLRNLHSTFVVSQLFYG